MLFHTSFTLLTRQQILGDIDFNKDGKVSSEEFQLAMNDLA